MYSFFFKPTTTGKLFLWSCLIWPRAVCKPESSLVALQKTKCHDALKEYYSATVLTVVPSVLMLHWQTHLRDAFIPIVPWPVSAETGMLSSLQALAGICHIALLTHAMWMALAEELDNHQGDTQILERACANWSSHAKIYGTLHKSMYMQG